MAPYQNFVQSWERIRGAYLSDLITDAMKKRSCPTCGLPCSNREYKDRVLYSGPLETEIIKTRKIFLEPKSYKGWIWKKELPRKFFIETKKIVDKSKKVDKNTKHETKT